MTSPAVIARPLAEAHRARRQVEAEGWTAPATLAEAYEVQAITGQLLGLSPAGWKAGSTNDAAQRRRGLAEPVYGRLFHELLFSAGAAVPADLFIEPHLEVEFVFRMGRGLDPGLGPFSRADVLAAIDGVALGVEIADGRVRDWRGCGGPACVADNVGHGAAVIGDILAPSLADDLADRETALEVDGTSAARGGGGAVLGDPVRALVWLANALARSGHALAAGQWVFSGTTSGIVPLGDGVEVTARGAGMPPLHFTIERKAAGSRP